MDLVVRGGIVVFEDGEAVLDVAVADGRVAALLEPGARVIADREIDASGCYVTPGAIDTHTHVAWPLGTRTTSDGFGGATQAAAISGTTTIVDFVPMPRGGSARASADTRLAAAEGRSYIDYSFHPILNHAGPGIIDEIGGLIRDGLCSFKVYTTYTENRLDDGEIWLVMQEIAKHGGLAGFHAENDDVLRHATELTIRDHGVGIEAFPLSRPPVAEAETINMVAFFARRLDSPVWIYHLSGSLGLLSLNEARASGTRIQAETCTHYLTFDDGVFSRDDAWRFVITPPIRGANERAELWRAIKGADLSAVGSDHCAYERADKAAGATDFTRLPAGAPGIGARFPFVWARGVAEGRLTVSEFVRVMSGAPARAMGLGPAKGQIAVGSDADLVIVDPTAHWLYEDAPVLTDYSLYAGMPLRGRPRYTLVRGQLVAAHGKVVASGPGGSFVGRRIDRSLWPAGGRMLPPAPSAATA